jgi:hypothetical protein
VLACGALVAELRAVLTANDLTDRVEVRYLPAHLHNRPERIVPHLRELLAEHDPDGDRPVLIGYADCGTGGNLDRMLADQPRLTRLPGDHCYEFFTGSEAFAQLQGREVGTFYLTDFLAKHFQALVWEGLGLDRHPELLPAYFGNYTRLVLLSQSDDAKVVEAARAGAERLGLRFEHHHTGLQPFEQAVTVRARQVV